MKTLTSLRKRAILLEPAVRIGKKGLTPSVISEIDVLLSKRGLIKVKMLRASIDAGSDNEAEDASDDGPEITSSTAPLAKISSKEDIVKEITEKTRSLLVQKVGLVFTLYREPEPKQAKSPAISPFIPKRR